MQRTEEFHKEKIEEAIFYIASNLDKQLSLALIAGRACLSPYHFHRLFKKYRHETLYSLIIRKRVEKSFLLITTRNDLYLYEVASLCGFISQSHFVSSFKKHYGCTPYQLRRETSVTNKNIKINKKRRQS